MAIEWLERTNSNSNSCFWNLHLNNFEEVTNKGAKKVKVEKRNFIVVNPSCNNIEHDTLLTKKEAVSKFEAPYYAVDIENGDRYEFKKSMFKIKKAVKKKKKAGKK